MNKQIDLGQTVKVICEINGEHMVVKEFANEEEYDKASLIDKISGKIKRKYFCTWIDYDGNNQGNNFAEDMIEVV